MNEVNCPESSTACWSAMSSDRRNTQVKLYCTSYQDFNVFLLMEIVGLDDGVIKGICRLQSDGSGAFWS